MRWTLTNSFANGAIQIFIKNITRTNFILAEPIFLFNVLLSYFLIFFQTAIQWKGFNLNYEWHNPRNSSNITLTLCAPCFYKFSFAIIWKSVYLLHIVKIEIYLKHFLFDNSFFIKSLFIEKIILPSLQEAKSLVVTVWYYWWFFDWFVIKKSLNEIRSTLTLNMTPNFAHIILFWSHCNRNSSSYLAWCSNLNIFVIIVINIMHYLSFILLQWSLKSFSIVFHNCRSIEKKKAYNIICSKMNRKDWSSNVWKKASNDPAKGRNSREY